MALPSSWVDALFGKLMLRYGAAFLRQYGDLDPAMVKSDWADVLDGFDGAAIGYALRYLPAEKPPNALQFRDVARKSPAPEVKALPMPPADPERVAAALEKLTAAKPAQSRMTPAQECAAGLRKRLAEGMKLTESQRHVLAACEGMQS